MGDWASSIRRIDLALDSLPEIARLHGIALAVIRRSHHAGVLGHPVERLAREGLMAKMFANASACIAPFGGQKPMFGTNPVAFAAPIEGDDPLVVDMALSIVPMGKVDVARKQGCDQSTFRIPYRSEH